MSTRRTSGIFVDGRWEQPADAPTQELVSPVTGEPYAVAVLADDAAADRAVALASDLHREGTWRRTPVEQRAAALERVADGLEARRAPIVEALGIELGQTAAVAGARLDDTVRVWRRTAHDLRDLALRVPVVTDDGRPAVVSHEPVGVVLAVTPWNSPILIPSLKLAPALAAGCPVVLKPATETVLTLPYLADAVAEAGLPPAVLAIVPADVEVSARLAAHPHVDKVTFTGSTAVGAQVMAACAPRIARVSLELGGKSAAVVLPGSDPDVLVPRLLAAAGLATAGQVCVARTRILVPRAELARWEEAIVGAMRAIVPGGPADAGTTMGPIATGRQLERVLGLVATGVQEGARVATGGHRVERPGFFVEPTLLVDVDPGSTVAQQEIFGPVVCLLGYDDLDEAVEIANGTAYGLAASVYGSDVEAAGSVADRLRAGTVHVNTEGSAYDLPFGGLGRSGMGREGGAAGIREFLETRQTVGASH